MMIEEDGGMVRIKTRIRTRIKMEILMTVSP
jgi:hypothetical protein